jgi:hypothetical protein
MKNDLRFTWARDLTVSLLTGHRPPQPRWRRFPSYKELLPALRAVATAKIGRFAFLSRRHTIVTFTLQPLGSGVI